jgi:hypothetical protein
MPKWQQWVDSFFQDNSKKVDDGAHRIRTIFRLESLKARCQSVGERTKWNSHGVAAVSERTGSWPNETDLNDKTVFNTPGIRLWEEVKQSHHTPWRRRGERRYSSYSFMASGLDGVSVQFSVTPRPRFTLTKRPLIPIGQEAGWDPEPVWTQRLEEKSLPLPRTEPRSPGRPVRSQTIYCVWFQVLTEVSMKLRTFWDVLPRS